MRDRAIAVLHRAERLDPLSLTLARDETDVFILLNDLASARNSCAHVRELDDRLFRKCKTLLTLTDARSNLDSVRIPTGNDPENSWAVAYVEAKLGMRSEARRDIAAYIGQFEGAGRYLREESVVRVYALNGDKDEAMKWLERGYAANSVGMVFLRSYPEYRSLYGDPRFEALVKKVGLK